MLIFLSIIVLHISCLILPGPDFFVTISNSIKYGYRHGTITALGIGLGILLNSFITYWLGSFLQHQQPWLFKIIILIGVSYLIYIAINLFKNVFSKDDSSSNSKTHVNNLQNLNNITKKKVFLMGAFTNLANVKAIIFFSSMLSLVEELSNTGILAIWLMIALITVLWFMIVAIFFGNDKLRGTFFKQLKKIEFVSGCFISIFSIIILIELFIS
ncbi:LysE family translocator [Pseudofrancisella aestuarii]|uniref:LysE family translocator n=1 Tax=Pseudofrancisella aestuarii TaxID=2670347 RepID=A0ABV9TBE9_9GAMM|nr:LysE family translocator [Pseudofrancisella aestuarii]